MYNSSLNSDYKESILKNNLLNQQSTNTATTQWTRQPEIHPGNRMDTQPQPQLEGPSWPRKTRASSSSRNSSSVSSCSSRTSSNTALASSWTSSAVCTALPCRSS